MIALEAFEDWLDLGKYTLFMLFGWLFFGPKNLYSPFIKNFVVGLFLLGIIVPFFVSTSNANALMMSTSELIKIALIIFFGFVAKSRASLQQHTPYFYFYWLAMALIAAGEFLLTKVVFSPDYTFYKAFTPIMNYLEIADFNFISPFIYLVKFVLLGFFFRDALKEAQWKTRFTWLVYALVVFEMVMMLVFKSYRYYDSLSSTIKNLFIIFGSGLVLYKMYNTRNLPNKLYKNFFFWVCISFWGLSMSELFLEFVFTKLYDTDKVSFYRYYLIRNSIQIVSLIVFLKALWQIKYLKFIPHEY
jgi:hypothetical protein